MSLLVLMFGVVVVGCVLISIRAEEPKRIRVLRAPSDQQVNLERRGVPSMTRRGALGSFDYDGRS